LNRKDGVDLQNGGTQSHNVSWHGNLLGSLDTPSRSNRVLTMIPGTPQRGFFASSAVVFVLFFASFFNEEIIIVP